MYAADTPTYTHMYHHRWCPTGSTRAASLADSAPFVSLLPVSLEPSNTVHDCRRSAAKVGRHGGVPNSATGTRTLRPTTLSCSLNGLYRQQIGSIGFWCTFGTTKCNPIKLPGISRNVNEILHLATCFRWEHHANTYCSMGTVDAIHSRPCATP